MRYERVAVRQYYRKAVGNVSGPEPSTRKSIALWVVVCMLQSAGCYGRAPISRPVNLPPLPPGTKIDMSSLYFKEWPNGRPALFRVRSDLILAVPPQYQQFWRQDHKVARLPSPISAIPKDQVPGVSFQFFLPTFTGYTPENYSTAGDPIDFFDPDEVSVIELQPANPKEIEPGAVGEYPPNMLKRSLPSILDRASARLMYGLTCYTFSFQAPETHGKFECWGRDHKAGGNYVMLETFLAPYDSWVKSPTMQARYFTPMYGGLRIVWRTNARNFSHWEEIDAQIWKFVRTWNVARNATGNSGSR